MGKCRICRGSIICFDFIETKAQPLQPECHLSPDSYNYRISFPLWLHHAYCKLPSVVWPAVTKAPSYHISTLSETWPFIILYLAEKQATWTGFINRCSKLAHGTSPQSLPTQKNLCKQPILFRHVARFYDSHSKPIKHKLQLCLIPMVYFS